ncbi:amino acid ABC transporter permease [Paenisporosarcina sp. TG20]|uniref:amino acid ABC transporter permease n=1 Tax=Paenisporosarcina sp. TG20 TaxID=1211706 RepID=UPI0002F4C285|nr:amino acid ABC transporter permease [Paenisporosarcina sp. TG20]
MANDELTTKQVSIPETAPPKTSIGVLGWLKENLFSSWINTILTVVFGTIVYLIVVNTIEWIFFKAEWYVISANFKLLMVGQYPVEELFRVWIAFTLISLLMGLSWGIWKGTMGHLTIAMTAIYIIVASLPFVLIETRIWLLVNIALIIATYFLGKRLTKFKKYILIGWFLMFPVTMILLSGFGVFDRVGTNLWGGFLLTLLIAIVAIVFSFPLGVLLALGRRSKLPVVKWFCVAYIELIRGVPLITILFVAQLMLPMFLGEGVNIDNVIRAMVGFTLFSAAYLAENIRGGLQSIPRGQFEAAEALGLNATFKTVFIILPQSLRAVIPAMVGQFIGIFKDTSLVAIVGLTDLLGMGKNIISNPEFLGTQMEVFLFVALVFLVFCNMMSYASRRLEGALGVGTR